VERAVAGRGGADMAALDALDRASGASIAREIRWWR
jgi:hypothetical protein